MTDDLKIPPAEEQSAAAPTAGQMMKEARLSSGIHIGTLSMTLKVPVKKLEALESEDWTVLPDVVFVRALATSVCRQIKIDSVPVLAALPKLARYRAIAPEDEKIVLNQPFRNALPISMPMVAGTLALLLAAVVLIFLPSFNQQAAMTKTSAAEVITTTAPIFPPPTAVADAPSLSMTSPIVPAEAPILRIAAKGVVWIEMKDSNGTVLVQRTLQAKEFANVSGQPPLAVVIGRINEIESITVRGKALSTAGMSPDNAARFEVQ